MGMAEDPERGQGSGQGLDTLDLVVLADDTELFREILADVLQTRDLALNVHKCADGYEAISAIKQYRETGERPDLIVLDVYMPLLDGLEVAEAVRRAEDATPSLARSPILFVTIKPVDREFREKIKSWQPAAHFHKGAAFSQQAVAERVSQVIEKLLAQQS